MSTLFHNLGVSTISEPEAVPLDLSGSDGLSDSPENESELFDLRRSLLPLPEVTEIYFGPSFDGWLQ